MKNSTHTVEDHHRSQEPLQPDAMELETFSRPRKRVFIFLLLVTSLVLIAVAFLLWWVPYVGLATIHKALPAILAVLLGCVVLVSLGAVLTLLFTIIRGKNLFFNRRIRGVVIRCTFPPVGRGGQVFRNSKI